MPESTPGASRAARMLFLVLGPVLVVIAILATRKPAPDAAATSGSPIAWQDDLVAAMMQASQSGRPVLIDFYADWCGPCKLMDETTYRDPHVVAGLGDFVPVKVDVDAQPALAQQFGVSAIPLTVILGSDGKPLASRVGAIGAEDMLAMLDIARTAEGPAAEAPATEAPAAATGPDAADPAGVSP